MRNVNTGTRSQPLGDKESGCPARISMPLAAYVASLNTFAPSPYRNADGTLTAAGASGRELFIAQNCAACHGGTAFSNSA
jgi:cytochrome c peroxidase